MKKKYGKKDRITEAVVQIWDSRAVRISADMSVQEIHEKLYGVISGMDADSKVDIHYDGNRLEVSVTIRGCTYHYAPRCNIGDGLDAFWIVNQENCDQEHRCLLDQHFESWYQVREFKE